MNARLQNQLTMIRACLTVAHSDEYQPVWTGRPPADFATDLVHLTTLFDTVVAKAAQTDAATGGATDAKAQAEAALEEATFVLARALATHFKRTGDLDRRGKVDFSKSALVKLRAQSLINQALAIRDLGAAAVSEPGAEGRSVTAERVAALTGAITAFSDLMSVPRGQVVNRGALLRDVEADVAAMIDHLGDMDDLVVQFSGTDDGDRFVDAWKHARIIVDAGVGHSSRVAPPPPVPVPTPVSLT
jgi:hypothetical protein